ncbi:kinase-like domain-containing protein [Gymnopilus junonius]|uniref:Kinase-like domain-containing protein n=1 Tax=Gymnopilus junonius TaxID=109634 RepID=A0A9P5NY39_GYMJU|nr:kinase-like domain-containing protein [Gymnopilus junonius]
MPGAVLKLGVQWELDEEVLCTHYTLDHLTIPCPRILRPRQSLSSHVPWEMNECNLYPAYYIMEETRGVSLDKVVDNLSMEEKHSIASQLREILNQMSTLKTSKLGSVSGGPYRTLFAVPEWLHPTQPFSSTFEFRDFYHNLLRKCTMPFDHVDKIMAALPTDSEIRFTHGDLLPKNIMVEVDGPNSKITGIIDWANSGFYPAFWEYARMYDPNWMSQGWFDILQIVFPGKLTEEGPAVSFMLYALENFLNEFPPDLIPGGNLDGGHCVI